VDEAAQDLVIWCQEVADDQLDADNHRVSRLQFTGLILHRIFTVFASSSHGLE
jgi:hypothetical protein